MPRSGPPLRLFVAIYPPAETVARLIGHLDSLDLPPHVPVSPDHVHLTLQFIGDTPRRDLRAAEESVERACAGFDAFDLRPLALASIPLPPDHAPPRLVAAMTDSPSPIRELHKRLSMRFSRAKQHDHFTPHLTLCRFPQSKADLLVERAEQHERPARLDLAIDEPPFAVGEIVLVESVLTRAGAVHQPVRRFELG